MSRNHVEDASRAHSMLNAFAIIRSILDSGSMSYDSSAHKAMQQISVICKREQARFLRKYDSATAAASRYQAAKGGAR